MIVPRIKKILYATDLSENSRNAFAYAATLANAFDARVVILHVVEEPPAGTSSTIAHFMGEDKWEKVKKNNQDRVVEVLRQRLEDFCSLAQEDLPECPFITQEILVKLGHPVDTILRTVEESGCDMVVVGSHGVGGFMGAMLGSTSRQITRRCSKPVLVVRLPA